MRGERRKVCSQAAESIAGSRRTNCNTNCSGWLCLRPVRGGGRRRNDELPAESELECEAECA